MDTLPTPELHLEQAVVMRGARRTVDRLDLQVPAGCVYALLGGNGAGKTTTLNVLLGFVGVASGRVSAAGCDPARDPAGVRARLSYLPENVALYPYLSGAENLRYFCELAGLRLSRAQADALLDEAGLATAAHHVRVAMYSKGMRQKVGLAIAQARRSRALLLDEPTSGLDPDAANQLVAQIRAIAARGAAVLMATHDLFNARQVSDRIGILQEGRLVAEFATASVSHEALERIYLTHARGRPAPAIADAVPGAVDVPA